MDLPIVGAAWPEEHDELRLMAKTYSVALRVQELARPVRAG